MSMYPTDRELDIGGVKIRFPYLKDGKFTNGDFNNPEEPASFIPAETINLILDNLNELIEAGKKEGEEVPSNSSTEQVKNAVAELIRRPIDEINNNLIRNIQNIAYPIGYDWIQIAEDDGTFDTNKHPANLVGGVWSLRYSGDSVYLRTEGTLANEGGRNTKGIQAGAERKVRGNLPSNLFGTGSYIPMVGGTGPFSIWGDTSTGAPIIGGTVVSSYIFASYDNSQVIPTSNTEVRVANIKMRLYRKMAND